MKKRPARGTWVIIFSLIVAVICTIIPLPDWAAWFRPLWVLMVLSYWALALDSRIGIGIAWLMGILLDILQSTVFGEHSLVLCLCIFVIIWLKRKLRMLPLWQQALFMVILAFLYQVIIYSLQAIMGQAIQSFLFWLSIVSTGIFWPWLFILLRDCRRRFKVS